MSCVKTAEPIEMPFGADSCRPMESCIGRGESKSPSRRVFVDGGHVPAHCKGGSAALRPFTMLLWTLGGILSSADSAINLLFCSNSYDLKHTVFQLRAWDGRKAHGSLV